MRSCYNCGSGISDIESFCGDNCESEYNDYIQSEAGDQVDNAAAAKVVAKTQAPPDRASDPSRQAAIRRGYERLHKEIHQYDN